MPAVKERYPYLLRAVSLTVCIAFFSGTTAAAAPRPEMVYERRRPLCLQPPLNTWAPSDTIRLEYALSSLLTAIKKPVDEIDMRIPVILEENGEKKRIAVANLRKTRIRVENGLWVVPCATVPGENFEALFTPDKRFVRLRTKGSSAKTDINALSEDLLMLPDDTGTLSVEAYAEAGGGEQYDNPSSGKSLPEEAPLPVPGRTGYREQKDDLRLPEEISAPFSGQAEEWVREYFPELRDYLLRLLLVIQKLDRRMELLSAEDCAAMASDLEARIPVKRIKKEVLAGGASEDLFLPIEQPVNLISQGVGLVLWRLRRCRERGTEMSDEKLKRTRSDISGAKENTSKLLEIFRRIWADGQEVPGEAERPAREADAPRDPAMRYYYFKEPLSADTRACVVEFFPELEACLLKLICEANRLSRDPHMTVEKHVSIERGLKKHNTFNDIWSMLRFKEDSAPGSMERIEDAVLNLAQGIQLISSRLRLRKERGTFTVDARVRKMIEDLQRAGDEAEDILSDLLMVLVEGGATPEAGGHAVPAEPPLHEEDDLVGYIEYMYHFVEMISAFGRDSSVWVRDAGSGKAYRLRLESWIRHRISNIFMILEHNADPSVLDFAKLNETLSNIRQSGFAGILSSSEYGFGELAGQLSGDLNWAGTEEDPLPYSAAILMYFLKRHFVEADNGAEKWDRFRKYARRFDHAMDRFEAAARSFSVSGAREEGESLYSRHDIDVLSDLLEPGADGFPLCFLEELIGLSLNHKVVLVFDERLGRGKAGGPLNSFLEAVARFRSDKRYAGVMKDLIVVSSDVKDVPGILAEHEDAAGTKVFTFAVESERSRSMLDPVRERTDARMVFIDENGIPDNAYYPLMEIVTMSMAEAFVRPDTISYDLKGLNIASVQREGGTVIFTLLPEAEEMSYGTLIKRYALFKRVLRAA